MNITKSYDRQRSELAASLASSPPPAAPQPAKIATSGTSVTLESTRGLPPPACANDFERIAALGYGERLVSIMPPDAPISPSSWLTKRAAGCKDPRGKMPGILKDTGWVGYDWTKRPATPDDHARWASMKAGVGLRLGDGLYAIDVDTLDPALAAKARDIVRAVIPGAHVERVGRAPKFLILLRVPNGVRVPYKMVEFGRGADGKPERIEGLSNGKQAVVAGVHPVTKRPYEWLPAMPRLGDVAEASAEQIDAFFRRVAAEFPEATAVRSEGAGDGDIRQAGLRGDPAMIEAAVARLPNTTEHFSTREIYRNVGYAIKASIPDDDGRAFDCFAGWSDRWQDPPDGIGNVEGYAESLWRSLKPPFRLGATWLLEKVASVTGESIGTNWFAPLAEPEPSIWDAAPKLDRQSVDRPAFEFVDFLDMAALALTQVGDPLVHGLLDRGSFVVLYGPSGCGKTFVALDLAFRVALGLAWNGRRVRRMRVVYIAAEGSAGARKRSEALRRRYGIDDAQMRGWFLYRAAPIDLLRPDADLRPAIEAIAAVPDVGLVVVDTMSRALAGGDENSPVDMGAYVRNLDRLRTATSACVVNVHHTGKDVARGARGHSLLRAATDTEIEVSPGEFAVTKQREIETDLRIAFLLDPVQLGQHEDGTDITSCVVRWDQAQTGPAVTEKEGLVLAALGSAAAGAAAKPDQIVEVLRVLGVMMTPETVRAHLKNLAKKALVISESRGRWLPKTGISELGSAVVAKNSGAIFSKETGSQSEEGVFA